MSVRTHVNVPEPWQSRASYSLSLLIEGCGWREETNAASSDADVAYTVERPADLSPQAVWIPADISYDWNKGGKTATVAWFGDLPAIVQPGMTNPTGSGPNDLPFDALATTYAIVAGTLERASERDAWGVVVGPTSRMHQLGVLQKPTVALLVQDLSQRLEKFRPHVGPREALWPNGKKAAIVMSHDVDAPFSIFPPTQYLQTMAAQFRDRRPLRVLTAFARYLKAAATWPMNVGKADPNFGFDWWVQLEGSLGGKSAFYVAVERAIDPDGSEQDVTYDYRNPKFKAAVMRAADQGWEIGLHPSINARKSETRIIDQLTRLKAAFPGVAIRGLRHHYWALDSLVPERTFHHHLAAGFEYDSSYGLNDIPGFRRGMCWPFDPYDTERDARIPLLQVPPTIMDGGVFYSPELAAEGDRHIREHLELVIRTGGAVVLDWHLEQANLSRLQGAGGKLQDELRRVQDRSDIWWACPIEVADWWKERRQRIAASA